MPEFEELIADFRIRQLGRYELEFMKMIESAIDVGRRYLQGKDVDAGRLKFARERLKLLDKIALARARYQSAESDTF